MAKINKILQQEVKDIADAAREMVMPLTVRAIADEVEEKEIPRPSTGTVARVLRRIGYELSTSGKWIYKHNEESHE